MKILLTFIGNNDLDIENPGPILSILQKYNFERIYLLYNHERYLKPASDILSWCRKYCSQTDVRYKAAVSENPTDYNTVYPAMYKAVKEITDKNPDAEFTISITSGTPTMHACWIFLQQGGMIKAEIIQISKESGVDEVDFSLDDFPKIQKVDSVKAELTRLHRENINLKSRLQLEHDEIIGECPQILAIKKQIEILVQYDIPVYISGESGTGKELIAEALHYNSSRKEKNLVKINCGAISPHLFESEFFGHKKGAFTGAAADKDGQFKFADGGTIFLDEIADLPLEMQVKLLRVLEYGTYTPVGSNKEEKVDVRLISATNKKLKELIKSGNFREDLFYRITQDQIELPPLRDRQNDILLIADKLLERLNKKYRTGKQFAPQTLEKIQKFHWPGNVRQLKHVIERAYIYADMEILPIHLNLKTVISKTEGICIPAEGVDFENEIVEEYYRAALKRTNGNAQKAAELLGMQPPTFRARLRAKNIKAADYTDKHR